MKCERIDFLGVPIDILKEEDIEKIVLSLLEKKEVVQIIFLSTQGVLKARRKGEFAEAVKSASLVIPISKSIINGAKFLKKEVPIRYYPFDAIISILNVINTHYKSLYMLGSTIKSLKLAEENVKSTFTELSFVGRYNGYYNTNIEPAIISAIVKSHPSVVLIGNGIAKGDRWAYHNRESLSDGIYIYNSDIIDIFSKQKRKTPAWLFLHGWEYIIKVLENPLRIFFIFKFIWFKVLLLFYRIRKK